MAILALTMKSSKTRPIYLDMCALRRPFDDQSILRNHIERVAVDLIKMAVRSGSYRMLRSPVHEQELNAVNDPYEHEELLLFLFGLGKNIGLQVDRKHVKTRAEWFVQHGFGIADAAHTAYAEACNADFITCDDQLLRVCNKVKVKVWCGPPDLFCRKEGLR